MALQQLISWISSVAIIVAMFNKLSSLFSSDIVKKISYLFSISVLSQIINLLTLPIITRLYSVEAFALQTLFIATASVISSLGTLQYHYSILSERGNYKKSQSLYISLFSSLVIASLSFIILSIIKIFNPDFLILNTIRISPILVVFFALINCFIVSFQFFLNTNDRVKIVANSRMLNVLVNCIVLIFLGIIDYQKGLVISLLISGIIQFIYLYLFSKSYMEQANWQEAKVVFREYKHLPLFSLPQTFLDSVRSNIFIFLIDFFYGKSIVGYYAFAERLVRIPISFVSSATSEVLFKYIADLYHSNRRHLYDIIYKNIIIFTLVLIVVAFVISLLVEPIVHFIFGSQWDNSIPMIIIIIPLGIAWFICSPLSIIPMLTKKQHQYLLFSSIIFFLSHISFFLYSKYQYSFTYALASKSIIEFLLLFVLCFVNIKFIKNSIPL